MAKTSHLLPFHILLVLFLSRISLATTANVTSEKGLSFQLLYSDSIHDPSLYANLTTFQRLERIIQSSESYFQWLRRSSYNTTVIRPRILPHMGIFTVVLSIGTPPGTKAFTLALNTGDSLTWTQCIPCNPSFPQTQPMFDPSKSPSYRFLPITSPLCHPPYQIQNNKCIYNIQYLDQTGAVGFLSTETFTFHASPPRTIQSIPNLVFGCTHSSHMNFVGEPSGILGMDRSRLSFVSQVTSQTTNGSFSYCLFRPSTASAGILRFGNDIVMSGPLQRTPIINVPNSNRYHLELNDISIDNQRLHLPARTFEVTEIDSGTVITRLIRPVYALVREVLVQYFNHFHLVPFPRPPFDLCYHLSPGIRRFFPNMTWHLRDADLAIHAEELFFIVEHNNDFCLGMVPDDHLTILGVLQQYNTRFSYDLQTNQLRFKHEDCSDDMGNL
ncbi:hypothetical protein J5N97_015177 [Dioscorea zingiberensis]|uniref:Peptidase A1 domain-containing protein n=1 Tax=Dioscorea zingiberensis TaxID=325984 RepID=A0A9D5CWK4_9LILI|nr:hypothetical protein J5N97_015177 [Dioscorea zingiberensis]